MNLELDDLTLQRFVDGELADDQRREILRRMDDDPAAWRRLALAFVEVQIWNEAFSVAEPVDEARTGMIPSSPLHARRTTPPVTRWIAVAAGWLLAVGLGYGAANLLRSPSLQQFAGVEGSRTTSQETQQADGGELGFEEAVSRSVWPVPDSLRLSLLRSGYYLDEVHTTRPVKLPTGEEIRIPVREVSIQYLGNAAFQ